MTFAYSMVQQVGEGIVHCIVGVSWEVWSHAMSVKVVGRVTAEGGGRRTLTDTSKDLLVTCVRLTVRVSQTNA